MFSYHDEVEMTRRYRKEHDLLGLEAEDLVSSLDLIDHNDIQNFVYPDSREIQAVGRVLFEYFVRWDPRIQTEEMIRQYSFESEDQKILSTVTMMLIVGI